jgi:hypothetical protein
MRILPGFLMAGLLVACDGQPSFDSALWKADSMTENHQVLKVRQSMSADIQRRFPAGTTRTEILKTFGTQEYDARHECDYPGVDNCLGYHLGATTDDYSFLIFAFRGDRLTHVSILPG